MIKLTSVRFLTATSDNMFRTVLEMQPRDAAAGGGGVGMTKEDKVKAMLDDILEKLPDEFNMAEIMSKVRLSFYNCLLMNWVRLG